MKKTTLLRSSIIFFVLAFAFFTNVSANTTAGVTYCSPNGYGCGYVGTDGNAYDWDNNAIVSPGTAKSVFAPNVGYGAPWSSDASAPFTINGGALAGTSFLKRVEIGAGSAIYLTGTTSIFCAAYACYPGENKYDVSDFDAYYGVANASAVVRTDGTSDVCSGSDNVAIWTAYNGTTTYHICKKSDGSYVSNHPDFVSPPAGVKDIKGDHDYSDGASFVYLKSDNTLQGINHSVPSGTWRDVRLYSQTIGCGVSRTDNVFKCWNSGTIFKNGTVPTTPPAPDETVSVDGLSCKSTFIPNINDVSWMTPGFFSLTGSFTRTDTVGGSQYACNDHITYSTCGDKITVYNRTDDGISLDRLNAYNYSPGETLIFSGSWQYPGTGNRSVLVRDPDYSRYMVALGSIRDGTNVKSDVFQFFSVANPSTTIPWAGAWNSVTKKWESVRAGTGGVATIAYPAGVSDIILQVRDLSVPPIGFRRGTANSHVSKVDCSKGNNQCNSYLVGTGMVCAGSTVNGYVGDCAFDTAGRCAPVKREDGSYTNGTPEDGANVIHDSQGNVVAVIPGGSAIDPGTGRANGDTIFYCDEDEGYISCFLHVLRNGWNAINDTFSSAESVTNAVTKTTQQVGSGSTGSLYTGTFSTGAEQDIGNQIIGGGWNVIAGDAGNDPLKLLAQRIWTTMIFLLFFFVIGLLIYVIRSRKNSNPDA